MANWWENDPVASQLPAKPDARAFYETDQIVSAPAGPLPRLNMDREGDYYDRGGASIKMTPSGVVNYLSERYGKGNVATDANGATYIRDPEKNEFYPLDSNAINMKDFTADMVGPGLEAGPVAASGGILAAIGGGAIGSGIRQGLSYMMGGDDELSLTDRAVSAGTNMALSGTGEALFRGGAAIRDAVRPGNVAARYTQRAMNTPEGQIGQRLERAGVPLSVGEMTLDPNILQVEGMLRRNVGSMDSVRMLDQRQLNWATRELQGLMDRISANPQSIEQVGDAVNTTFRRAVDQAVVLRRNQARSDFARVNSAAGQRAFIQPQNTVGVLDELINRYSTPGGGDRTAALATRLQSVRASMAQPRSAVEVQRLMEVYGDAAQGTGSVFRDIDRAQEQMIAGQVVRALDQDLATAASQPGVDAITANELQIARQNYAQNSQPIDDLRRSVLGQFLGNRTGEIAPSEVFNRLKGMDAPSLARSFRLLQTADPEIAQTVKRGFLEDAFRAAYEPTDQALVRLGLDAQQPFSAKRFAQTIKKSPAWELMQGQERQDAEVILTGLGRMAQKMGEGSPTAPLLWAKSLVTNVAKTLTLDTSAAAELAVSVLAPRRAAQLLMTQDGRQALLTVASPNPVPRKAAQALLTISALGGVQAGMAQPAQARNPDLDAAIAQFRTQGLPGAAPSGLPR